MRPHILPQSASSSVMARPMGTFLSRRGINKVADSGARCVPPAAPIGNVRALDHASYSFQVKSLGSVRFMGIGSHKEGNRAGQHGVRYPQAKPDGSPAKAEADDREQFLEKAKAESASNIDDAQVPFRDSVESGQTLGEATTELQFGVKDGKNTSEAIRNASEELFKQSTSNGKSGDPAIKEEDKRQYPQQEDLKAEVSSEAWASNDEEGGTHSFLDDAEKVDFRGQEHESILGIGGQRASESLTDEATGSGGRARENIENTRSE